jgi:Cys-rich protein (TIGR01571 family)
LKIRREHFFAILHFEINAGGLYDCCDDCGTCCYGCWCTACLYAKNAVQIDGSDYDEACCIYWSVGYNPLAAILITDNRTTLRLKYGLVEEPCSDCLVIACCASCAVCQAARELKIRNNMPSDPFFFVVIIHISKPLSVNERILMKVINS